MLSTLTQIETDRLIAELANLSVELRRYIQRIISSRRLPGVCADDILQEVWIAVLRWPEAGDLLGTDRLERWLKTVARRRVADAIRHARRLKRGGAVNTFDECRRSSVGGLLARAAGSTKTPSTYAANAEAVEAMRIALAQLPHDQREAVTMHFLDGVSKSQTATSLEKSQAAVSGLVYRGTRELRRIMRRIAQFSSADGRFVALQHVRFEQKAND